MLVPAGIEGQHVLVEHALEQADDVIPVSQDQPVVIGIPADRLENFLESIGRTKFIGVLYKDMMDAGMDDMARRIFEEAAPTYHPLAAKEIATTIRGQ